MNKFLKFLSILLALVILYLAYPNAQAEIDFLLIDGTALNINLFALIFLIFGAGILSGLFYACGFYLPIQQKMKEYKRKLEKTVINSDEETSKVAVLESKIETLEIALKAALKKNLES